MIVRQTRLYRLAELFFDEGVVPDDVDVIEYFQWSEPLPGTRYSDFYTLHLDLTQAPETLWAGISKNCRDKIHRAEGRDGLVEKHWSPASGALGEFIDEFDRFADSKGIPPAPRERLRRLDDAGVLDISAALSEGKPLVWRCHMRAAGRARALHKASLYRSANEPAARTMMGRASRYLQWQDILYYQGLGMRLYDFGGWYHGHTDADLLRINNFKAQFGGQVVREFHCARAASWRGRAVLSARALRRR
jgi:hypothetical protein